MHVTKYLEWRLINLEMEHFCDFFQENSSIVHEHHSPNAACFEAVEIETPHGNSVSDSRVSGEERCKGGGGGGGVGWAAWGKRREKWEKRAAVRRQRDGATARHGRSLSMYRPIP